MIMEVVALLMIVASALISPWFITPLALYALLVFLFAAVPVNCTQLGILSILTSTIQIVGYGIGYFTSWIKVKLLRRDEYGVLENGFYS